MVRSSIQPDSHQAGSSLARALPALTGLYLLIGGITSFLGWALDIRRLTDWEDNGISIQPNATVCVTLTGLALLALSAQSRRVATILGAIIALIGGLTLTEWITGANFGFDSLLMFGREWGRTGVVVPGRMGPPGSTCWTLIGSALLLASAAPDTPRRRFVPVLALITLTISTTSIVAYLYGASNLFSLPRLTVIAFQTATFIATASIALIAFIHERNPMRTIIADDAAGMFARRMLPAIVAIGITLGFFRVQLQELGHFDTAFGTTLRTVIEIVLMSGLLFMALAIVKRHHQAERDLARRNQAILGSITDAFYTLDSQWRFFFVNDEIVKRFGMPREDIIGRNIWELFPKAVGNEAYVQLHKAMAERISVEYDVYYEPWEKWFHDKAYPKDNGGLAVYSQDITERKAMEAQRVQAQQGLRDSHQTLSTLVELCPFGMYIVDADFRMAMVNRNSREGAFANVDPLIGRPFDEVMRILWPEPLATEVIDNFRRTFQTGEPYYSKDFISPRVDEDMTQAYEWELHQTTMPDGRKGVICYYYESTKLRVAEQIIARHATTLESALEQRTRELTASNEMARRSEAMAVLGALASGIAHDLSNLLLPMQMRLDLLNAQEASPAIREHLQALGKTIEYMRDLGVRIRSYMRDAAKESPSDAASRPEPLDLGRWCRQTEPFLKGILPARGAVGPAITLECRIPDGLPHLPINKTGLTQAVYNLVQNSAKAMNKAHLGERIIVAAFINEQQGVSIAVIDDGPGMSAEVLARCAQPHFTTDGDTGGTGLGLALVKAFVESHGGELNVYSPPASVPNLDHQPRFPRGTAVVMRFPAPDSRDIPHPPWETSTLKSGEVPMLNVWAREALPTNIG